ncbi:MAG TPA: sigma-70 family RNA polymerase sigma factor [Bryobacteraceae bacterium]|nr:sigma-70 family RNA polymerase sigma factor [Bryobacteraceae bacterium]
MAPDDHTARLRLLIDKGKESGFVLFDEVEGVLPPKHNGGRALEDTILAIESSGLEILDEPRAEFEAKLSADTDPKNYLDDPVKVYVREVGQVPLLSRLREFELRELIQSDHPQTAEQAKKELVEGNLRVVVAVAQRYADRGVHVLDLIMAGNEGLMSAVQRFDGRRGYRFSSYAIWWIRQSIIRAARVH